MQLLTGPRYPAEVRYVQVKQAGPFLFRIPERRP